VARILKRESAKRDLIAQWVWYAENADVQTTDRFLNAVDSTASLLARQPDSGLRTFVQKPEIKGIRRFPLLDGFESIILFYLPLTEGIELVRVVHGNRDLDQLLTEGPLS
jgi:toxin ParE1/3/4